MYFCVEINDDYTYTPAFSYGIILSDYTGNLKLRTEVKHESKKAKTGRYDRNR